MTLEDLTKIVAQLDLDCGDNSCYFARKKGGMRTNGGCRCLQDIRPSAKRRQIERVLRAAMAFVPKTEVEPKTKCWECGMNLEHCPHGQ